MKKTVQIVTIPLDKQGFATGDICKCIKPLLDGDSIGETTIATHTAEDEHNPYWQAQQLLVLSDDEIQEGDSFLEKDITEGFDRAIISKSGGCIPRCWVKKIIASYPQIEGTLPISKETVQAWIDTGTPEEGSVDMLYWCKNGDSLAGCEKQTHCNCSDNTEADIDSKGNLLLEFDKKSDTPYIDSLIDGSAFKNSIMNNDGTFTWTVPAVKPAIPTDEEIEKKAKICVDETWAIYQARPNYKSILRTFKNGYKQALKDLGYE